MNFEHYRNFTVIVESGTFSAASQKLMIAQPALSCQVKALESEYGAQLLNRGSRRLELTSAGKILYERAKSICYLEESVRADIKSNISGNHGVLRLGLTHASVDPYIEKLILAFHDEYPGIQFDITLHVSGENAALLNEDKLDIAFIRVSDNLPTNLNYLSTVEERLMVYYSEQNAWVAPMTASVDVAELKDVPLCLTRGLREKLLNLCQHAGFSPNILCTAATRDQTLMWAENNLAVAVLFCNISAYSHAEGLKSCPITSCGKPVSALRSFVTCWDHAPSAAARLFSEFVQNYNAEE